MGKDEMNKIKTGYVRMCLQANIHNALTSYYFLLAKKMTILGEPLMEDQHSEEEKVLIPKEK